MMLLQGVGPVDGPLAGDMHSPFGIPSFNQVHGGDQIHHGVEGLGACETEGQASQKREEEQDAEEDEAEEEDIRTHFNIIVALGD